jgi:hypothetical protein
MEKEIQTVEGEEKNADLTAKGFSKKQQRIADLVKDEVRQSLKAELTEELESKLEQLAARTPDAHELSADDPALLQVLAGLQDAGLQNDPAALRLLRAARGRGPGAELRALADLAALAVARLAGPAGKASHAILPSGGAATPDLRGEYERRVRAVRPGDLAAVMEVKREFRRRGLEVF